MDPEKSSKCGNSLARKNKLVQQTHVFLARNPTTPFRNTLPAVSTIGGCINIPNTELLHFFYRAAATFFASNLSCQAMSGARSSSLRHAYLRVGISIQATASPPQMLPSRQARNTRCTRACACTYSMVFVFGKRLK